MPELGFEHSENVLQLIWKKRLFSTGKLRLTDGRSVQILQSGQLNDSDGPDFLAGKIIIEEVELYGAIEIHRRAKEWYAHQHHLDANYNNVVLHVVAEPNPPRLVRNKDGHTIATLNLLPYLPEDLRLFLTEIGSKAQLPCTRTLSFISHEAFMMQLEKAQLAYLGKKSDDFLAFFHPSLPPSIAWKEALVLSVFDGLGISKNRAPMIEVGRHVLKQYNNNADISIAGIIEWAQSKDSGLAWKQKGVRPGDRPSKRIAEGIRMADQIRKHSLDYFYSDTSLSHWNELVHSAGISYSLRYRILFATVYLPALYNLSGLLQYQELQKQVIERWNSYSVPIPKVLLREFEALGERAYRESSQRLGAIHQLKAFCKPRNCADCEVLKNAILS